MTTYLVGALFDGEQVLDSEEPWAIRLEGGRITTVVRQTELAATPVEEIVDVSHLSAIPGLIDAHTHVVHDGGAAEDWKLLGLSEPAPLGTLRALRNARRHLEWGVTTIRDLGAWDGIALAVRTAIDRGLFDGPRLLAAGRGITASGGHMDPGRHRGGIPSWAPPGMGGIGHVGSMGIVADSPWEARRAVREQLSASADLIKVNVTLSEHVRAAGGQCSPEMTPEMLTAVCDEAHRAGRRVAGHCHGGVGVTWALEAGVDTFEHGRFLTDEQLGRMAENDRSLVPTLSPEARRVERSDPPADPALARWSAMATAAMYDAVRRAATLGVNVVAGTDAGMPHVRHGTVAFEMQHLAIAGLSNLDALRAATSNAARALGLDDRVGRLRAGHLGDVVFVSGAPWNDLGILLDRENIKQVLKHGTDVTQP